MKHCSAFNCTLPIWSNGYCKFHLYLSPKAKKQPVEPQSPLRHTKPSPISSKRIIDNKSYRQVCDEIDREAIANKEYVCFFCGEFMAGKCSHHHLRGRAGKLMTDKRYIIISHNHCHVDQYHRYTVVQLLETGWYGSFLVRLRMKDEVSFEKEMRKLIKYFDI